VVPIVHTKGWVESQGGWVWKWEVLFQHRGSELQTSHPVVLLNINTYRKVNTCTVPVHHSHNSHWQVCSQCKRDTEAQEQHQHLQVPHSKQLGCNKSTCQLLSEVTAEQCQETPPIPLVYPRLKTKHWFFSGASWNQTTHYFVGNIFNITISSVTLSHKWFFPSGFWPSEKRCRDHSTREVGNSNVFSEIGQCIKLNTNGTEVKNEWSYTAIPSLSFHCVDKVNSSRQSKWSTGVIFMSYIQTPGKKKGKRATRRPHSQLQDFKSSNHRWQWNASLARTRTLGEVCVL
jgi:hypothetical protein